MRTLSLLRGLALIGPAFFAMGAHAEAAVNPQSESFESVSWAAAYQGRIAGKRVQVNLQRIGGAVMGSYCYEPCNSQSPGIRLEGGVDGAFMETSASQWQSETMPSGRWKLGHLSAWPVQQLQGQWSSMDGKRQWKIEVVPVV